MTRSALVALLSVLPLAVVGAATPAYDYHGCVLAPTRAFPHDMGPLSAAGCQSACSAYGRFAAIGQGSCRCSPAGPNEGKPITFSTTDATRCSAPCAAGQAGLCGGEPGSSAWSLWYRGGLNPDLKIKRTAEETNPDCSGGEGDNGEGSGPGGPGGSGNFPTITGGAGPQSTYWTTTVETITACPPDVVSCPARVTSHVQTVTVPASGSYTQGPGSGSGSNGGSSGSGNGNGNGNGGSSGSGSGSGNGTLPGSPGFGSIPAAGSKLVGGAGVALLAVLAGVAML